MTSAGYRPLDRLIQTHLPDSFGKGPRHDIDATRYAIDLPWSNGQAEGQINRLKR